MACRLPAAHLSGGRSAAGRGDPRAARIIPAPPRGREAGTEARLPPRQGVRLPVSRTRAKRRTAQGRSAAAPQPFAAVRISPNREAADVPPAGREPAAHPSLGTPGRKTDLRPSADRHASAGRRARVLGTGHRIRGHGSARAIGDCPRPIVPPNRKTGRGTRFGKAGPERGMGDGYGGGHGERPCMAGDLHCLPGSGGSGEAKGRKAGSEKEESDEGQDGGGKCMRTMSRRTAMRRRQ